MTPRVVRGYSLDQRIGEGGFGVVYVARQQIIERDVAVKVIHDKFVNQPEFIRRFEIEAQLIARLEHPRIVPIYDYWRDNAGAFLVMRLLPGGSAGELLAVEPLSLQLTGRIVQHVAEGLSVAHSLGIVHRDIKPANILFDNRGNVYLTDFGIAIDLHSNDPAMLDVLNYGSLVYTAPEQLRYREVSQRSDTFSLGVTVFELLTGDNPFAGSTTKEVVEHAIYNALPPISNIRSDAPSDLDAVLWKATAKDPDKRYIDVMELAYDFNEVIRAVDGSQPGKSSGRVTVKMPSTTANYDATADFRESSPLGATGVISDEVPPQDGGDTAAFESPPSYNDTADFGGTADFGDTGNLVGGDTGQFAIASFAQNPYMGLRPFEEADGQFFFGRETQIDTFLERLKLPGAAGRLLAVVGPSGSGKSSLVLAGLLPRLHAQPVPSDGLRYTATMTPSADPFAQTADVLMRKGTNIPQNLDAKLKAGPQSFSQVMNESLFTVTDLVLVVDQFEELYTQCKDPTARNDWLDALAHLITSPDTRYRVIITLRADFYDRPLLHPVFGELLRAATVVLRPMTTPDLERVILRPAVMAGVMLEDGLSAALLDDVSRQDNALPLLQHTLRELFDRRQGNAMRMAAYRELGGVGGAVAARAELIYRSLQKDEQAQVRLLFLRLVTVDETRQRVRLDLLLDAVPQAIIDHFAAYRMLTLDRDAETRLPTVEVAHEALITHWKRLRRWINENRETLQAASQLATAAKDWHNNGKAEELLARGTRLAAFEALLTADTVTITPDEKTYIAACLGLQRRRQRITLGVIALLSVLLIAASALGAGVWLLRERALDEAQVGRSRELAAVAQTDVRPDVSLLLSLEALAYADTFEARSSLLTTLMRQQRLARYLPGPSGDVRALATDASGIVVGGANGLLNLWTADGTHTEIDGHVGNIHAVALRAGLVASVGDDGALRLWTLAGEANGAVELGRELEAVAFSQFGVLAGGAGGRVEVYDPETLDRLDTLELDPDLTIFALDASGPTIAAGASDGNTYLWQPDDDFVAALPGHTDWVWSVDFNSDGTLLATGGQDQTVGLWEVGAVAVGLRYRVNTGGWARSVSVADGAVASANGDGSTVLLNTVDGSVIASLGGHTQAVNGVAFADDGVHLLTASTDGSVAEWDLASGAWIVAETTPLDVQPSTIGVVALSGDTLVIGDGEGAINGYNLQTGDQQFREVLHDEPVISIATDAAGAVVSLAADGSLFVWQNGESTRLGRAEVGLMKAVAMDTTHVYAVGDDDRLIVWDRATGSPTATISFGENNALTLALGGGYAVVGTGDGALIRVSLTDTAQAPTHIDAHDERITALHLAGDYLYSGDAGGVVRVWAAGSLEAVGAPIVAHSDWVTALALLPDGLLATGSRNAEIRLWEPLSGRQLAAEAPLIADPNPVHVLGVEPQGLLSITGRAVRWRIDVGRWQARACEVANRNLSRVEQTRYLQDDPPLSACG